MYTPVQVQKILFLLDKKLNESVGGPYFNFEPYHYGPFDKNVYKELDKLTATNDLIVRSTRLKYYAVTPQGYEKGIQALNNYAEKERNYIKEICTFVKSLSFEKLLKAIYNEYPEMKANSIFLP